MKYLLSIFLFFLALAGFAQTVPQVNNVPWYEFTRKLSVGQRLSIPRDTISLPVGALTRDTSALIAFGPDGKLYTLWNGTWSIASGGGDSTYINFDLPGSYVITDGDTIDVNVVQYMNDSIRVVKSGDTLFFPNGDTLVIEQPNLVLLTQGNSGDSLIVVQNDSLLQRRFRDSVYFKHVIAGDGAIVNYIDSNAIRSWMGGKVIDSIFKYSIINQEASKENKAAWIRKLRVDTIDVGGYVISSGTGSPTANILRLNANDGNIGFAVRYDGTSRFGNNIQVYPIASATGLLQLSGGALRFSASAQQERGHSFVMASRNTRNTDSSILATSPAGNLLLNENFTVSSGTGIHSQLDIRGTINQTGTATGVTQGILINQTITAASDYKAIRVLNGESSFRSISLNTAGDKIKIATGSNASIGTATLVAGTVTVNTTAVTASSIIMISVNTPGGTQGFVSAPVASIVAGTSFVINSSSNTDTSTINWWIIN